MQTVRELFARHGLRCTKQREQVYEALAATKLHPTAEELFHAVRALEPGLSLATVYNCLEAFLQCGLARRLACPSGSGPCRYDADISDHVHLATADGGLVDVPPDLSERLLSYLSPEAVAELEHRMGVRVSGVSIQVVAAPAQVPAVVGV